MMARSPAAPDAAGVSLVVVGEVLVAVTEVRSSCSCCR
jgi:hypothetical protein